MHEYRCTYEVDVTEDGQCRWARREVFWSVADEGEAVEGV